MGRYEPCPYNPIMRQTDETAILQRCGHGKPVMTQTGQWYMVYLCGRGIGEGYSLLGRETALDPITWTPDGWPIVNNLDGPSTLQRKPDLPETVWEETYCDDFKDKFLGCDWMFPRSPEMDGIAIKLSWLRMKGSRYDLNSMHAKNVLLRRQQHFKFQIECKMKMPRIYPGQDAGVTCYYDENTFLKFALFATQEENPRLLVGVREYVDGYRDGNFIEVNPKEKYIYFRIEVNNLQRVFYASFDGVKYVKVDVLSNVYYLCDEGLKKGKRFTGAMVGMYAHAGDFAQQYARENGARVDEVMIAEFDYFNYKPV
jgi:xylan 1,4-beta-xylosidase